MIYSRWFHLVFCCFSGKFCFSLFLLQFLQLKHKRRNLKRRIMLLFNVSSVRPWKTFNKEMMSFRGLQKISFILLQIDCFEVYPFGTTSSFTKKEHTTDKAGQSFLYKETTMTQVTSTCSSMRFMWCTMMNVITCFNIQQSGKKLPLVHFYFV